MYDLIHHEGQHFHQDEDHDPFQERAVAVLKKVAEEFELVFDDARPFEMFRIRPEIKCRYKFRYKKDQSLSSKQLQISFMKKCITLFLFIFFFCLCAQAQAPDLILFNGKIFTAHPAQRFVQAIAIRSGKVFAIGSNAAVQKLAGHHTEMLDLGGRTVVPGFNDAHYHHSPFLKGYTISYADDGSDPSWQQLKDSILTAVKQQPAGTFLYATMGIAVGTDSSINRFVLDALAPQHPLVLHAMWGHVTYFNTAAMKALGIREEEPDIKGGIFERIQGTKRVNGRAFEHACNWIAARLPTTAALFDASLQAMGREALYFGVTSIQNMCTGASLSNYIDALHRTPLPIRFRLIRWGEVNADGSLALSLKSTAADVRDLPLASVSGTKWMLEGTPIERLAAQTVSYKDQPGWKGKMDYSEGEVRSMLNELRTRKDQPMFHVVGEKTTGFLLSELQKNSNEWMGRRVRFEHGDALLPPMYAPAKKLGVVIVQNPSHFTLAGLLHQRFTGDMEKYSMPLKSLVRQGIPVALGSDGPLNPFLNIMFACLHPFHPGEALTVEEAVIAYTKTAAYAEFADNKGTLMPGKLADLVVLSNDIFTMPLQQLPATHSVLTIVNGKIAYRAL